MIDPSDKKLLRRQFLEVIDILSRFKEVDEARHLSDIDSLEEEHLDELPNKPKNQPFFSFTEQCSTAEKLGK